MHESKIKMARRLDESHGEIIRGLASESPFEEEKKEAQGPMGGEQAKLPGPREESNSLREKAPQHGPKKRVKGKMGQAQGQNSNLPHEGSFYLVSVYRQKLKGHLQGHEVEGQLHFQKDNKISLLARYGGEEIIHLDIRNAPVKRNYLYYTEDSKAQRLSAFINRYAKDEFIITLVNGKRAGTKLKFVSEALLEKAFQNKESDEGQVQEELGMPASQEGGARGDYDDSLRDERDNNHEEDHSYAKKGTLSYESLEPGEEGEFGQYQVLALRYKSSQRALLKKKASIEESDGEEESEEEGEEAYDEESPESEFEEDEEGFSKDGFEF